jgi:chemotaxis signal transduction protein
VTFRVGENRVAVPAADVQEVRRAEGIVPVPFTAPVLSGIIRAEAIAVPVYDPGQSEWPMRTGGFGEAGDHILVLRRGETLSGLLVSRPDTAELMPGPRRPGGDSTHPLEVGSWYGDGGTFARVELDGLLRLLGIPTEGGS